jgi:hypothetical protein
MATASLSRRAAALWSSASGGAGVTAICCDDRRHVFRTIAAASSNITRRRPTANLPAKRMAKPPRRIGTSECCGSVAGRAGQPKA